MIVHTARKLLPANIKSGIKKVIRAPARVRDRLFCRWKGVAYKTLPSFYGLPRVDAYSKGSIRIGSNFKGVSAWRNNSIGTFQPLTLRTRGPDAKIVIGDRVGISGSTISACDHIEIGDDVLIGSGCLISDSDAHALDPEDRLMEKKPVCQPIHIQGGVFIGARCIILKGVTIGRASVVGAGSVVTRDVPPDTIVAGNPAKEIKKKQIE